MKRSALNRRQAAKLVRLLGGKKAALRVLSKSALLCVTDLVAEPDKNLDPIALLDQYPDTKGYRIVENDSRLASLSEVDFTKVKVANCFKTGDKASLTGEERLQIYRNDKLLCLGLEIIPPLLTEAGGAILEWLHENRKARFFDLMGTVFESPDKVRSIMIMYRYDDSRWTLGMRPLAHRWPGATLFLP